MTGIAGRAMRGFPGLKAGMWVARKFRGLKAPAPSGIGKRAEAGPSAPLKSASLGMTRLRGRGRLRRPRCQILDVEILDVERVVFNKFAAGFDVFAHQRYSMFHPCRSRIAFVNRQGLKRLPKKSSRGRKLWLSGCSQPAFLGGGINFNEFHSCKFAWPGVKEQHRRFLFPFDLPGSVVRRALQTRNCSRT